MKRLKKYRNFYIYFLQFQSLASSSANTTDFESNFGSNSFEKLNSLSDKQEVSHYSDRLCYFYAAFTIEDNCNNNKYNKDIYKRNRCLLN